MQRLPLRRWPLHLRCEVADQRVAAFGRGHRRDLAQRARLAVGAVLQHRRGHLQRAPAEQPVEHAFTQRPGLDAPARRAGARAAEQAAFQGQPAAVLLQAEAVVLQEGQGDREQPHHHQEHHDQQEDCGRLVPAAVVLDHAEQAAHPGFDDLGEQVAAELRERGECAAHHDHAAVGDQARADDVARAEADQHVALLARIRIGWSRARARFAAPAPHQRFQCHRIGQRQHAHLRFGLDAAGRFQSHLGHAEDPVQHGLAQRHVLDARERDLAQAAFQQAAADLQAVDADAEAIGVVLPDRDHRQHADRDQAPQVVAVAAPHHEQHDQRQDELAQLLDQHEQPRHRMQPALRRRIVQRHGEFRRLRHGHHRPAGRSGG